MHVSFNIVNPVCVVDDGNTFRGNTFNGLPVFCGIEAVTECVEKYDIRCAVIAEWSLSTEFTDRIRRICKEKSIELREFLIGTDKGVNEVEIRKVLDLIKGPVRVIRDGLEDKIYPDSKSALRSYSEDCVVDSLSPSDGEIVIHIHHTELAKPVASEEWIRKYREETGDDISFF